MSRRNRELDFRQSSVRVFIRGIFAALVNSRTWIAVAAIACVFLTAFPAQAQTFTAAAAMKVARYDHTSTMLQNGSVLITGGCQANSNCNATAELYNPTAGTFTLTGTMFSKRWAHTATLLNNGLVLITGGCTGGGTCVATTETYNPQTGGFSVTGNMEVARYSHTATLLKNGTVLITGGCSSSGNCNQSAEIYDPTTGTFKSAGLMTTRRYSHAATLLNNGKVLISGGCTGGGTCQATAEIYDPSTGAFTATAGMSVPRYMHTATLLGTGKVLTVGGCSGNGTCRNTADLYDPATGLFTLTGSMSVARYSQAANLLFDGTVLVSGGCAANSNCNATAELYHPATGTFTLTGSMTTRRWGQGATLLNNGMVITTGGCTGGGTCLASADLYHGPVPTLGLVNPKYVVLGVVYSPPGSRSSVDYGSSTALGTSTSIASSFSNANTESISVGFTSDKIFGIFGNEPNLSVTATSSNSFTQEQDSTSSVTINKTSSLDSVILGPASDYVGVDHDFDLVYIWLNPVMEMGMLPSDPTKIQFLGYRFDLNDPRSVSGEMEVVQLQLAQLKNPALIDPATQVQLARTWAPNLADGSPPGLNPADLLDIAASDPFSNPTYTITISAQSFPCTVDGRFCNAPNVVADVSYLQPAPGGQPGTTKFAQTYQTVSSTGQTAKDTHQVGFSLDTNLTNGFLSLFSGVSLKASNTLTWTNSFSSTSTSTANQSATVSVTSPACVVPAGGTACNPVYTGSTAFNVFVDTVYNTFLLNPSN